MHPNKIIFLSDSKKTFSVLNYLHNYCVFARHTYSSTILDLKEKLHERDQLKTSRRKLRKELEEAKIEEENNTKAIKELDTKIPRQKEKFAESSETVIKMKNEILRLAEELEQSEMQLLETKNELDSAQTLAVSDEEIQSIINSKENVEKQLENQEQIAASSRQKLQDNSRAIKEAMEITEKMEAVLAPFEAINTGEIMTGKKHLEELNNDVTHLKSSMTQNRTQYSQLTQTLEFKKNAIAQIQKRHEDIRKRHNGKETAYKKELKEKKNLQRKLVTQEAALNATYRRLLDERERTFKVTSNVIKQISRNLFEDD